MCHMRRAVLVLHRKRFYDDESIAEMKLWLLPKPVRGSKQPFKYSLFYGRNDVRLIGYDNEAGKGDHRHYVGREEVYQFTTPEKLMVDFLTDVRATRRRRTD